MRSFIIYHKGDQINEDKMGVTCSTIRETGNAYKILVEKHDVRPLGRYRCR